MTLKPSCLQCGNPNLIPRAQDHLFCEYCGYEFCAGCSDGQDELREINGEKQNEPTENNV